ncbi:hypothetical protein TIFTF001_026758 [Ficus carica]|uniref:Uncharacterized protein n=1 Tax=Ficus carica TaxID=3494 RepID=A0AA88IZ46_FICCA|nr:hypothetical protein TIFTF001_026758 [Ficus carica]
MVRRRNWRGDDEEVPAEEPPVHHALRRPNTRIAQLDGHVGELSNTEPLTIVKRKLLMKMASPMGQPIIMSPRMLRTIKLRPLLKPGTFPTQVNDLSGANKGGTRE